MTPLPFLALVHTPMGRIRIALAGLCLFLVFVTFESIRRTKLKERYALLWFLPCALLAGLVAFPGVLNWMRSAFGLTYASSVSAVVFLSLMVAAFVLSTAISTNERNLARIAQRCAMLEARLRAETDSRAEASARHPSHPCETIAPKAGGAEASAGDPRAEKPRE